MTALYIGGAHSGKTALARRMHPDAPLLEDFHTLVRDTLHRGESTEELLTLSTGKIVICDEVGCGIVPLDAFDRAWREEVGKLCCAIAKEAALVVRVTAGLPQVLKGAYA